MTSDSDTILSCMHQLALPESGSLPSAGGFAECFLSGTRQSPKLGKDLIYRVQDTRHSPTLGKDGSRQRAVSGRLQLTAVSLCQVPNIGHSAKDALSSVFSRHSAKYIFNFFLFWSFVRRSLRWQDLTRLRQADLLELWQYLWQAS